MQKVSDSSLYIRKYKIIIGTSEGDFIDLSNLKCEFNIKKNMSRTPNLAEVVIYNLSPKTENILIKYGEKLTIEAGYENSYYGTIYSGQFIQIYREKEDSINYKLTILAQDSDDFVNNEVINASYAAGQTNKDMIDNLASISEKNIEVFNISKNLNSQRLVRGKIMFGLSKHYLHQIAKSNNAAFYINDGKINIVKLTDLPEGEAFYLDGETGLIGTPEQTKDGIIGRCLLNPLIDLNTFININTSSIKRKIEQIKDNEYELEEAGLGNFNEKGMYRVIELTQEGDTRGDAWYTHFTAIGQNEEVLVK